MVAGWLISFYLDQCCKNIFLYKNNIKLVYLGKVKDEK